MATLFKDRVRDTSTDTGTGNFTIANSAPSGGFQTFNTAYGTGSGNQFYYCIQGGNEWEVGIGYLSDATTLVRSTILGSSNSNSEVSFSAGTKDVFSTIAAARMNRPYVATASDPAPTALASGTRYRSSNTSFTLPASAGCVAGETVYWLIADTGISIFPNGSDTLECLTPDQASEGGAPEVGVLAHALVEIRYVGSGVWNIAGWGTYIP